MKISKLSKRLQAQKEEEERQRKIEEERKKEEMKQYILRKIREEETIIKIKFTNEEFLNYIIKFFEDFVQIFYFTEIRNFSS